MLPSLEFDGDGEEEEDEDEEEVDDDDDEATDSEAEAERAHDDGSQAVAVAPLEDFARLVLARLRGERCMTKPPSTAIALGLLIFSKAANLPTSTKSWPLRTLWGDSETICAFGSLPAAAPEPTMYGALGSAGFTVASSSQTASVRSASMAFHFASHAEFFNLP